MHSVADIGTVIILHQLTGGQLVPVTITKLNHVLMVGVFTGSTARPVLH